jgi:hypothetical protein
MVKIIITFLDKAKEIIDKNTIKNMFILFKYK